MTIDRKLVARAFAKAGEEPITEAEWEEGTSSRVRVVKDFYLAAILEALSLYDWTSQKKRGTLEKVEDYFQEVEYPVERDLDKYYTRDNEGNYEKATSWDAQETYYIFVKTNFTPYFYMYLLPADCAKCVSLNDGKEYMVEGAYLYTNEAEAILLYIKNYFTGQYVFEEVEDPQEADLDNYYIINEEGKYVKAETWDPDETYYIVVEQDYNFYGEPELDPQLSAFIECSLAARIALKITGDMNKYQMLYNEALLIGNNAQKKSAEMARNKSHGNEWWTKQLGME